MKKLLIIVIALLAVSAVRADEGMWLLSKLRQQNMGKMQEMGLKLTAEEIYDINESSVKDAIVGLGHLGAPFRHFCSAEIISQKGLLVTNHHCAFGSIQSHSSVEHDYLKDGFWAYKLDDELSNPGVTASILDRMEDVSERVNVLLNDEMSAKERRTVIDSISKVIVKEAEKDTKLSGQVQSMFEGNQFYLFLYTIYKDVRLVGAPPQSMGKFGGDTDNWMWPRHTADFALYRIYTAPDGTPAEYAKENIPLKPKHHLPVSTEGVKEGDFAMIMGFPGSTDRFLTSYGLENTMDATNDIRYKVRTVKLDVLREAMANDQKTRIQYASKYAGCSNYWKYSFEQNKALKQLNTKGNKELVEKQFAEWVNADANRKAVYGDVLPTLKAEYAKMKTYQITRTYLIEALGGAEAHTFASRASHLLKKLCDKETSSEDKAKLEKQLQEMGEKFYKNFNTDVDAQLFASLFKVFNENVDAELHPEIIELINTKYKGDYEAFASDLKAKSAFMSESAFNAFIEKPSCKKLEKDLAYIAGKSFSDMMESLSAPTREINEKLAKGKRLFVRGLMEMNPEKSWASDANSTIRLTYGKVGSYKPRDAVFYDYYTTLSGVIAKEGADGGEFEMDDKLKELHLKKDFAPYGVNDINVNFITDHDITGGNSGSAVINAKGHLIGTAFDGNSEAMSGDIDFEENLQRCINVDARYMLWIIDKHAGAKNLINEMTIIK